MAPRKKTNDTRESDTSSSTAKKTTKKKTSSATKKKTSKKKASPAKKQTTKRQTKKTASKSTTKPVTRESAVTKRATRNAAIPTRKPESKEQAPETKSPPGEEMNATEDTLHTHAYDERTHTSPDTQHVPDVTKREQPAPPQTPAHDDTASFNEDIYARATKKKPSFFSRLFGKKRTSDVSSRPPSTKDEPDTPPSDAKAHNIASLTPEDDARAINALVRGEKPSLVERIADAKRSTRDATAAPASDASTTPTDAPETDKTSAPTVKQKEVREYPTSDEHAAIARETQNTGQATVILGLSATVLLVLTVVGFLFDFPGALITVFGVLAVVGLVLFVLNLVVTLIGEQGIKKEKKVRKSMENTWQCPRCGGYNRISEDPNAGRACEFCGYTEQHKE